MLSAALICTLALAAPPDLSRLPAKHAASRDYAQTFLELSERAQAIVAPEQNGYAALIGATEGVAQANDDVAGRPMRNNVTGQVGWVVDLGRVLEADEPREKDLQTIKAVLAAMDKRGVFTRLRELGKARGTVYPKPTGLLLQTPIAELPAARYLARALRFRMRFAADEGKWDEVAAGAEDGLALARAFIRRGSLVENTIGMACAQSVFREADLLASRTGAPGAPLKRILAAVDGFPTADIDSAIECEREANLEAIERCLNPAGAASVAPSAEIMKKAGEMYDRFAAAARARTLAERKSLTDELSKWASQLEPNMGVLAPMPEAFKLALASRDMFNTDRDGIRILLAIEAYRAEKNGQPASLNQLAPGYLMELPTDLFAPDHQFRYVPADASSDPRHRTYLLYSVGLDAQDNRGKQHPEANANAAIEAAKGRGYDYLINPADDTGAKPGTQKPKPGAPKPPAKKPSR